MENKKDGFISREVGNYQICFDENFIIPLNYMNEDKIIITEKGNYIVLRHATVDLSKFAKISRMKSNIIKQINSNHIGTFLEEQNKHYLVTHKFTDCKLVYIAWENEEMCSSNCKIVIKYDKMHFIKNEECTNMGVII